MYCVGKCLPDFKASFKQQIYVLLAGTSIMVGRTDMLTNPRPFDKPCPECGAPVILSDWWDDPEEYGGACIGVSLDCTQCDWDETR